MCCLVKEGHGQLREHSGGRSCDGVTRNKSDIKLQSDPLAPVLEQSAVTARTPPLQPNTKNTLSVLDSFLQPDNYSFMRQATLLLVVCSRAQLMYRFGSIIG